MILIVDNYDSFTYNLLHYIGVAAKGCECIVYRNDEIGIDEIRAMSPKGIVISPGPKDPQHAGISLAVIDAFYKEIPILGVCLGYQSIGYFFGATVVQGVEPVHGKVSRVLHNGEGLFDGMSNPFNATRYHSLILDGRSIPSCLDVTAWTEDGVLMGVKHKEYPIEGVQFHPESVMTVEGSKLVENWMERVR